jgi:hypothetical protein
LFKPPSSMNSIKHADDENAFSHVLEAITLRFF